MKEFRTCDSVLAYFQDKVKNKIPISTSDWLEAAQYLNTLRSADQERLFDLEQLVAQAEIECMQLDHSAVAATKIVKATPVWKEMKKQEAKLKNIEEMIRIAKKQATNADNEWRKQI